jgi:hypothetical protein
VLVPPVDHDCVLSGIVAEMSNELAKLRHEVAQLKKSQYGRKSERSKMPRRTRCTNPVLSRRPG